MLTLVILRLVALYGVGVFWVSLMVVNDILGRFFGCFCAFFDGGGGFSDCPTPIFNPLFFWRHYSHIPVDEKIFM